MRSEVYNIPLRFSDDQRGRSPSFKEMSMSSSFAATMRRANRLIRPPKQVKTLRNLQKAMAGAMVEAAFAPFSGETPKTARRRKLRGKAVGSSLGTALKQLRSVQATMGAPTGPSAARHVMPNIPDGAQYLARRHRSTTGSRGYKLYLPASQPQRPKGLIVMLHGCSQTPDDFAIGTHMNVLAEKHGLAIAYPAQVRANNAASCWNWFKPGHQIRGAGEPAILASLTRKLMKELELDRDAVFVSGLSAGGAMAVILADLYPELYSAAGVHSGLALGSARDVVSAMSVMRSGVVSRGSVPSVSAQSVPVRRVIFQGDNDSTVHPANAATIVAAVVGGDAVPTRTSKRTAAGRGYIRHDYAGADGAVLVENWMIEGAGHAWSGGRAAGSYTDRKGPDASAQMIRFFLTKSA